MSSAEYQDKTVVGVSFEGRPAILREMAKTGDTHPSGWKIKKVNCILKPEENNKYDKFAIGVWIDDKQVGYIPKDNRAIYSHITLLHPEGLRIGGAIFLKGQFNPTLKLNTMAWFQLRRQSGDFNPGQGRLQ